MKSSDKFEDDYKNPRWRTFEHWGSINSTIAKSGSDAISPLSRSSRCYQAKDPIGETVYQNNYFGGTPSITPGPGSYQHATPVLLPKPSTSVFSHTSSQRLLTESHRLYALPDIDSPPGPGSYNIVDSSAESSLRAALGVARWKLRILKDKEKSKDSLAIEKKRAVERELKEHMAPLIIKIKELKKAIAKIENSKSQHISKYPTPHKPPFTSTGKKWHQIPDKIQEAPTYYTSSKKWDFGAESRTRTPKMSSFQYAEQLQQQIDDDQDIEMVQGLQRQKSYCRDTSFFGMETDQRMSSPPVGGYGPVLVKERERKGR
eukprot:CAMPEP_0182420678 /NCGR_PEP_ID=MMETSP1167-20130531/5650_1 /TAXON_ID=2988 /ORGANISM="Mallomonas Sp, Strain CCMP3275" /LENGTH=316 /DNA_ID=CAMNT_0024596945 /DNA_START=114 /DNA_END=1064 /DNA_ORIENTATION=-